MKKAMESIDSQMSQVREQMRELGVRSEEELDRKLEDMEHRMTHEVVPLAEEKRMVMEIKRLSKMRETVRNLTTQ